MTNVQTLLKRGVITLNCGMTKGGEGRLTLWTENGPQLLGKFPLPIVSQYAGRWYDPNGLWGFWTYERPELGGKSILDCIQGRAGFGFTYWGADLVLLDKNDRPLAAINYPTALQCKTTTTWVDRLARKQWHIGLGGCAQAAYQPAGQLHYLQSALPRETWDRVHTVVPVTDYLSHRLTGYKGHDATMLQSQGLRGTACQTTAELFHDLLPTDSLCPWVEFNTDAVMQLPGSNLLCIPGSHDSVDARAAGFSAAPFVVWTGSWVGVAANIEGTAVVPSAATMNLGLSFEGINPPAIQRNTGMFGSVYDVLRKQAGLMFEGAAGCAERYPDLPLLDPAQINSRSPEDAARYVLEQLGEDAHASMGVAAVLHTAVHAVCKDLQKLGTLLKRPVDKVAVVGGFANNTVFCELLGKKLGTEVLIPPHAANATDVGYLANMLRRMMRYNGEETKMGDILQQLPKPKEE